MPEELVGVVAEKRTSWSFKEFTPEGIRFTENGEGHLEGLFDAAHYATGDVLLKWNNTLEFEWLAAEFLANGDTVRLRMKGKGKLRMSPTTSHFECKGTFETKSKKLSWLNSAEARLVGEGTADAKTSKLYAKR